MSPQATEKARLILVCGMVGAGKTTLARRLETRRRAIRLSPDEWLVDIAGGKHNRRDLDRLRGPVEKLQWSLAKRLLALGQNVILENGFWVRDERLHYLAEARRLPCQVELHWLDVPLGVLQKRLAHRNEHGGAADIPVSADELAYWMARFEPPDQVELARFDHAEIHVP